MEVRVYYLYRITNQANSKIYIGQSIDPDKRWKKHLAYSKQENKPQYIHRAMAKYGAAYFILEVIATCKTQEDADATEVQLILQYDSRNPEKGYNLCRGGEGGWFGKKHTEESKEKNRQAHLGTVVSDETKKKMSEIMREKIAEGWTPKTIFTTGSSAAKYWQGKKRSEESIRKTAEANKGRTAWNKGKQKTLTETQIADIQKLLSEGNGLRQIAKITGIGRHVLSRELKRIGIR